MISVIIVTFNSASTIVGCLDSIAPAARQCSEQVEIVVVDNGSTDKTASLVADREEVRLVKSRNSGFGSGCNRGATAAAGDILVFLNPDASLQPGALSALRAAFDAEDRLGAIGGVLFSEPNRPTPSFHELPTLSQELLFRLTQTRCKRARPGWATGEGLATGTGWISGALLAIRRTCFDAVDGFDENFFLYYEDMDLGLKVCRQGYLMGWLPLFSAFHVGGVSSGGSAYPKELFENASAVYLARKHFGPFGGILMHLVVWIAAGLHLVTAPIKRGRKRGSIKVDKILLFQPWELKRFHGPQVWGG